MSKIVIPIEHNLLSKKFSSCTYFLIYEISETKMVRKQINLFPDDFRTQISDWYENQGITNVIAHSIDQESLEKLSTGKINLFLGVKIDSPDALVDDLLEGRLKSNPQSIMDNCNGI